MAQDTEADARTTLDFEAWSALFEARDAIYRLRQKELSRCGLTAEQSSVLHLVHELGGRATPANLSRLLFRKSQSVSELLNRMSKDGLITKTKDLERRNMVRVAMTPKAEAAYALSIRRESIHHVMSQLPGEQVRQMMACLEILRDAAREELGMPAGRPL